MYNTNAQGKGHKVAATQETITAQNSANQGTKKTFDGTKELFNAVDVNELERALSRYDFGIVKPGYIISNLKMAQRLIDKARMSDDQKAVLRNSYGFLLTALCCENEELEHYEHVAEFYYPEDLKTLEFDDEYDRGAAALNEIANVLTDWGEDLYYPEDWKEAKDVINEYLSIIEATNYVLPDWVKRDIKELDEKYED